MKILILGSGGREHTFAWKLVQSPKLKKLFVVPGNAGTENIATNVNIAADNFEEIKKLVIQEAIEMVIVGPEDPLVKGVHDFFIHDDTLKHVCVIGPQKAAAKLEGSKDYAKKFMFRYDIPTAGYQTFTSKELSQAEIFLLTLKPPFVLKADGLAAGKGVLILDDIEQAKKELKSILTDNKFGSAGTKVVIEEFLKGIELSVFVLTDGKSYKILPTAKDYKRIGEGDTGLNTGGMGAISPPPFVDNTFLEKVENRIVIPTIEGLKKDKTPYQGFIFIGLMKIDDNPFVIEYNVRMGDPETEAIFPRLQNDFVELFDAVGNQKLKNIDIKIDSRTAATVILASGGYPESYDNGKEIRGANATTNNSSIIFHAGTKQKNGKIYTNGGRVLAVTSIGTSHNDALEKTFETIKTIDFENMYYRKDIGFDL